MKLPMITIVTPSFNQDRFLEQAIRSVLEQDYPDLEYIVMDGGSSDGSVDIIRKYADRLVHWESHPDAGQADAIHRGFERATGEILGWLNSDDFLLPGALVKVGRYFADHPEVECAVGGGVLIDDQGLLLKRGGKDLTFSLGDPPTFRSLLHWEMGGFYQPSCFWRKEAYQAAGGVDPSLRFCMDYDLFLRLAERFRFGRIPGFLSAFRHHPASKSSTLHSVCLREKDLVRGRYRDSASIWRHYLVRRLFVLRNSARKRFLKVCLLAGLIRLPDPAGWPSPPPEQGRAGRGPEGDGPWVRN